MQAEHGTHSQRDQYERGEEAPNGPQRLEQENGTDRANSSHRRNHSGAVNGPRKLRAYKTGQIYTQVKGYHRIYSNANQGQVEVGAVYSRGHESYGNEIRLDEYETGQDAPEHCRVCVCVWCVCVCVCGCVGVWVGVRVADFQDIK